MSEESVTTQNREILETQIRKKSVLNIKLLKLQTALNSVCNNNSPCKNTCCGDTMSLLCKQKYLLAFKKARIDTGLYWKLETLNCDFLGGMLMVNFRASLTDSTTGEKEEFLFSGMGDGENAISAAFDRGFEFFINSNFRLCLDKSHSNSSTETHIASSPANLTQIEAIAAGLERLCESGADGAVIEAFQETITEDMTWHDAQCLIDAINHAANSQSRQLKSE